MVDMLRRALDQVNTRIKLLIGKCVLLAVDDSTGIQLMQMSGIGGETRSKIQRIQEYGFTSNPHPGAEMVCAFIAGNRDHGVVIAVDDKRYRLKNLQPGEVALYTDEGDSIVFGRGNKIEIFSSGTVSVKGSSIKLGVGSPTKKLLTADAIAKYNLHTHTVTVDPVTGVGLTGAPIAAGQLGATHTTSKTEAS